MLRWSHFNLCRLRVNTVIMILLWMPVWIPVYSLYTRRDLILSDAHNREQCLLSHTFYHPQSGECHQGLERGPCDPGELLVPDLGAPGVARCQQTPAHVGECHTIAILESGELTCLENTNVMDAFTQGNCSTGDLLMPANFELNKKPCPDNFHCSSNYQQYIEEKSGSLLYGPAREFLRNLQCDKDPRSGSNMLPRSVCLPDNGESPFLPENIYHSFKNPELVCQKNPCPQSLPTLDENGYYICQKPLSTLWSGSNQHMCRLGRIFRRGRCVSRFFG